MAKIAQTQEPVKAVRQHRATFARDKYEGGWNVRVIGPHAGRFAGRPIPVTRMDDSETVETLDRLIWTGLDTETGRPVALYSFTPAPRAEAQEEFVF